MKQSSSGVKRISMEMLHHQGSWSIGFLCVVLVLHILFGASFTAGPATDRSDFFTIMHNSTRGYMLVIGIIAAFGFINFYVRHGFTRKEFYGGAALAAVLLSLGFTIAVGLLSLIIGMIGDSGIDSSTIGRGLDESWLLSLVSYGIQILVYYIMGWMIGSGFYRYDWIRGLAFIPVAIVLIALTDALWQFELASLWGGWLPSALIDVPVPVSLAGTVAIIALGLVLVRLLTRRVAIKP